MEDEREVVVDSSGSEMGAPDLSPKTRGELVLDIMFWIALSAMGLIYFAQFRTPMWDSWDPPGSGYAAAHVGAAGVMMSLWYIKKKRLTVPAWITGIGILLIFAITGWYFQHNALLLLFRPSYGTPTDLIIGISMLVATFYLSFLYWGPVFPGLGLLFVAYLFFADNLPGALKGPSLDVHNILTREVQRAFFQITELAARFLWMLVFWGLLMGELGGGVALMGLARKLSGGIAGGPAMGSLLSSALAGSFVGGGASNVAITGPVTIPAMKSAGYLPEEAASVEAMASNASSITPPILGSVAFIMSDLLGVSYLEIIIMSIVPAMLWFLAVGTWILTHGQSNKHRIKSMDAQVTATGKPVPWHMYLRSAVLMVIPVTTIVMLVVNGYTLKTGAFWAFLLTMALAITLRIETRPKVWANAFRNAGMYASSITIIIVIVALISDALIFTGLGGRLGGVIEEVSGGHLIIAATIMVFAGVILGGPLPALPVYFIMIITFAPVLQRMGVPQVATHYVAFYMGALGSITLPVAASCLVAAAVANTKYWPTSVMTAKVSWPLWVYPIMFALAPELLLQSESSFAHTWFVIGTAAVVMVGVQSATGGWLLRPLSKLFKTILYLNFGLLVVALLPEDENPMLMVIAIAVVIGVVAATLLTVKSEKATPTPAMAGGTGGAGALTSDPTMPIE